MRSASRVWAANTPRLTSARNAATKSMTPPVLCWLHDNAQAVSGVFRPDRKIVSLGTGSKRAAVAARRKVIVRQRVDPSPSYRRFGHGGVTLFTSDRRDWGPRTAPAQARFQARRRPAKACALGLWAPLLAIAVLGGASGRSRPRHRCRSNVLNTRDEVGEVYRDDLQRRHNRV